ncbi:MAG: hypothetical protein JSU59_03430 [Nitrospirota bacterium]|nr:MAG: hypothetical protein JSU59_03430 [Nitrospirota bacterium]
MRVCRVSVARGLRYWTSVCLLILIGMPIGCSHWRDDFFDDGVDEITQEDVRKKLGKPHIVKDPFLSEETTWIYRYGVSESEMNPVGVKTLGQGINVLAATAASLIGKGSGETNQRERVLCVRYVLVFDESKVLRQWTREPCQTRRPNNLLEAKP